MWLSTAQRQILLALLSTDKPLTIPEIASGLSLSGATIRRQIPVIQSWLQDYDCRLAKPRSGKLQIQFGKIDKAHILITLSADDCPAGSLGRQERLDLLTFLLHIEDRPRTTQYFQEILQISRSTLLEDLSEVAHWYESRHLFLIRRPHFGVQLMGKESDWRKVFVELVLQHFDEPTLFHFCSLSPASNQTLALINPPLAKGMSGYLATLKLAKSRDLVRLAESRLKTRFADSDHLLLTLHIALLIKRASEQKLIEMDPAQIQTVANQPAYQAASEIAGIIQETFSLLVPQSEVGNLTIQFLGAKLDTRVSAEPPVEAEHLAREILKQASSLLKKPLDQDRELQVRLATHLVPTIQRLLRDLPIRNPLLADICSRYPHIYATATISCQVMRDYLGKEVPADEIAYISMYLAGALTRYEELPSIQTLIVCPSGSATSWLLNSRLKKEFPGLQVIDICSTRDLQRGLPGEVDLIISTVPLPQVRLPLAVVNALLPAEDILKIQKTIEVLTKDDQFNEKRRKKAVRREL